MDPLPPLALEPLPKIDFRHVLVLTDSTSILQHATSATPELQHGYCTDDTARSLIAGVFYYDLHPGNLSSDNDKTDELIVAMQRYLAFLAYAQTKGTGRFKNFMNYDRSWMEKVGSEDSHARALWGLGITVRRSHLMDIRSRANELFLRALPPVKTFAYIRPWAYALLGVDEYLRTTELEIDQAPARELHLTLTERLWNLWQKNADEDWPWWEDELTWGNAKLPHALLVAGQAMKRNDMVEAALTALRWLIDVQTAPAGHISVIGNRGWFRRGHQMARYDQQPIEAKALVQACLAAAYCTRDAYWVTAAKRCFQWFTGHNDVAMPLYNPESGGGYDGLGEYGISKNQGAESTLAYVMSVLELHRYHRAQRASLDFL